MGVFAVVVEFNAAAIDPDALAQMAAVLAYRSRDGAESRLLTHARARVAAWSGKVADDDATRGETLPLTIEDCTLVADARIDDRAALVATLRGHKRDVGTDTPDAHLILHAYLVWGDACVDHLLGDYAFLIWDGRGEGRVFAARDPIGKRILYYAAVGESLIVASEMRAVRAHPAVSDRFDDRTIADFLLFGATFWLDKAQTPFADVRLLPAAHTLTTAGGGVVTRRFWQIAEWTPPLRFRDEGEVIAGFREVFRAAIADRLRADRAVLMLSGGMDSPSIAVQAVDLIRGGEARSHLAFLTLKGERLGYREDELAAQVTAGLGVSEAHTIYDPDDYRMFYDPDYSFADLVPQSSPGAAVKVRTQLAALGSTVIMGAGGDVLFRVGTIFDEILRSGILQGVRGWRTLNRYWGRRLPLRSRLLARLRGRGAAAADAPYPYPSWLHPDLEHKLDLRARWHARWTPTEARGGLHQRHPLLHEAIEETEWYDYLEINGATDPAPVQSDPFLDVRVITMMLSLPPLPFAYGKYLLRRMGERALPQDILWRRKTAAGATYASEITQPENAAIDSVPLEPAIDAYIVRDRLQPMTGVTQSAQSVYLNSRVHSLNDWLRGVRSFAR